MRAWWLVAGAVGAALALSACGSGAQQWSGDAVVAEVGHVPITRTELAKWMSTLVRSDLSVHTSEAASSGLVAEPADPAACMRAVQAIAAPPPTAPTRAQLRRKCEELHGAIQQQALSRLIVFRWRMAEARRHGIVVSDGEVERRMSKARAERAREPGGFIGYLKREGQSLTQARSEARLELALARYGALLSRGSQSQAIAALFRHFVRAEPANRAATHCATGYAVVHECGNYAPQKPLVSPAVLIERVIAGE